MLVLSKLSPSAPRLSPGLNFQELGFRLHCHDTMDYLDLTLPTSAENIACDEALLDWRERGGGSEILRIWEPLEHFVVLGHGNKAVLEVNLEACRQRGIPILRRCSGGGTVLQGPGCLNYALLLNTAGSSLFQSITRTNAFIMQRNAEALASVLGRAVQVEGFTDLAINAAKVSGNAQRRRRNWILFHGTFLLDFDASLMEALLRAPSKQPHYRQKRSHTEFLARIESQAAAIKTALRKCWGASEPLQDFPHALLKQLCNDKYSKDEVVS